MSKWVEVRVFEDGSTRVATLEIDNERLEAMRDAHDVHRTVVNLDRFLFIERGPRWHNNDRTIPVMWLYIRPDLIMPEAGVP